MCALHTLQSFLKFIPLMKYLKHCVNVIGKIFSDRYAYGSRIRLCTVYLRLIIRSILFHKSPLRKQISTDDTSLSEKIFDATIRFFSYGQLIDLFEEIFIFQHYKFETGQAEPLIVDCGSNIGISVLYFKKLYPKAKVVAIEPDPDAFAQLEENIRRNGLSHVTLYHAALSSCEGEKGLYKKEGSHLTMSLIPSSEGLSARRVLAQRLSTLIQENVELLKVDVEGAEIEILDDLIENKKIHLIERMIIEYHPYAAGVALEVFIQKIESAGFFCMYKADRLHPGAGEVMLYCSRQS